MADYLNLPPPVLDGDVSVETAMRKRRSIRHYRPGELSLAQISQILWSAQGLTHPGGFRTVPSAGALYPLEIYLVAGKVKGLSAGVYHYRPQGHTVSLANTGDQRSALCTAALGQPMVGKAAAVLVICAVYQRMTRRYGRRGAQYVHMEIGHAGQNIALQCVALGLGSVMLGAFNDDQVQHVIGAQFDERPLYMIPIGFP
ncbi:MAG: SagB/ThcOx family dehydrogenase [Desulfobacteraceae bacterium]|jgi:SagB-type dehydrogenase family enzyme